MLAVFIISLVISVALSVDTAVAQGLANDRNNKITKAANKVYTDIAKDRALLNQLYEAYLKRDARLGEQILQSSPFGNRIRVLKQAMKKNQTDLADTQKKQQELEKQQTEVSNKVSEQQSKSQTSGSAIGDLISGAAKDPTNDPVTYKSSGVTEQTIQEVNYGQK